LTAFVAVRVSMVSAVLLAAYAVVFGVVLRRMLAYNTKVAESAVLEERRRLAREYHDGLAQELAYIVPRLRAAADSDPALDPLSAAAERAMRECRLAIDALSSVKEEDLSDAVIRTAETIAAREGTRLELDVTAGIQAPESVRVALVRVAGEAMTNAVRHGRAERVQVGLNNGNGIVLTIEDDGVGFDVSERGELGFGLVSMEQRVRAVGGELRISSRPGGGTTAEARIP
jgi:signal transduction histidine kinase